MYKIIVIIHHIGKAAGKDKKLFRDIESRFNTTNNNATRLLTDIEDEWSSEASGREEHSGASLLSNSGSSGMSAKLLYYLVSIMNMVFPDYDFRYVKQITNHNV